jgi:SAM-dependent methyltransferase
MKQTPVHEQHNPDLLKIMPASSMSVIEVGCSSGALAREFKKVNSACDYHGVEIDADYTELAKRFCDSAETLNIDNADQEFYSIHSNRDCWVFGDTLEHLSNPWNVLKQIRQVIPEGGCVVACIPNAQHWSIQAKLSIGDFRYEESGLLDKTHLRWFTRQTLLELFRSSGFEVDEGWPRIFNEPHRDRFLPLIGEMAKAANSDPQVAMEDALPFQYVVKAVPV